MFADNNMKEIVDEDNSDPIEEFFRFLDDKKQEVESPEILGR